MIFSGGVVQASIPAAGVIGGANEEPLDINSMNVDHPVTSAGPFEIVTVAAASVLWEVPSTPEGGGVTRTASEAAAMTVVGGWEALGLTFAQAGAFEDVELVFHIEPFGKFRADSTRFKLATTSSADFVPFFPPGSSTSGTAAFAAGTRISARGKATAPSGTTVVAVSFGVRMRKLPV